ncbi:MAG: hypothetical protein E6G57_17685, partial [Actinobacteria bacterium]
MLAGLPAVVVGVGAAVVAGVAVAAAGVVVVGATTVVGAPPWAPGRKVGAGDVGGAVVNGA